MSAPLSWDEIDECDPRDFTIGTMPARFAAVGDRHADMETQPCSLETLLELAARHEREGLGDAPWPPHYKKQAGEPARVQPSRRRTPKFPLIEIGRAARKEDALAGLERWRARHPEAAAHLAPADVLVDAMRGRFHTWTRVRLNLQHVPEALRPAQEALDPDDEPPSPWNEGRITAGAYSAEARDLTGQFREDASCTSAQGSSSSSRARASSDKVGGARRRRGIERHRGLTAAVLDRAPPGGGVRAATRRAPAWTPPGAHRRQSRGAGRKRTAAAR